MTDMLSHAARMIEEEGAAAEEGGSRSRLRTLAPLVATWAAFPAPPLTRESHTVMQPCRIKYGFEVAFKLIMKRMYAVLLLYCHRDNHRHHRHHHQKQQQHSTFIPTRRQAGLSCHVSMERG
jgi:hypothetical protein